MSLRNPPGVSRHAQEQMAARMGRQLTADEWADLVLSILDNRALLLSRGTHGGDIYAVQIGAVVIRAVWKPDTAIVATILPQRGSVAEPGRMATWMDREAKNIRQSWGYRYTKRHRKVFA